MTVEDIIADQEIVIILSLIFIVLAGAFDTLINKGGAPPLRKNKRCSRCSPDPENNIHHRGEEDDHLAPDRRVPIQHSDPATH